MEIGIENLEIVYKLDVKDPELLYNLGLAYIQNNRYQLAKVMLKDLEGLEKTDSEINNMVSVLKKILDSSDKVEIKEEKI